MTTSGSSGRKGLFVYDQGGWATIAAQFLYFSAMVGTRPRLPRLKLAAIGGGSPAHMSRRGARTLDVGVHRILSLPVTRTVAELVGGAQRLRPGRAQRVPVDGRVAGRGAARWAAATVAEDAVDEQRAAHAEAAARIEEAFGVRPFDLYATTEGLWGGECERHEGPHLFEEDVIAENVDGDGRAVPDGTPGARLLVTNLANRVQPLIRLEVCDAVTLSATTCGCGRTLRRLERVEGRAEDIIWLPGADGRPVAVVPMQFSVVARDRDVVEFQVAQEGARLVVLVVGRGAASGVEERVRAGVAERLHALGLRNVEIDVRRRDALERSAGGKLALVVAGRPALTTA